MSQPLYLIPVLLVLSSLFGASVSRAPVSPVASFMAPQLSVLVGAPTVVAGEQQTLRLQVEQSAERLATVELVVTYPNGKIARTLHEVRGRDALLTWRVPPDVGNGQATFSLAAAGCGCDQQGTVPPPLKLDSSVAGVFSVTQ